MLLAKEVLRINALINEEESKLEKLKLQMEAAKAKLKDQFEADGINNVSFGKGREMTYLFSQEYLAYREGKPADAAKIHAALRECGLGSILAMSFNAKTLNSKIKELRESWQADRERRLLEAGDDADAIAQIQSEEFKLPPKLAEFFDLRMRFDIRIRKS